MDFLELSKKRCSVREFEEKQIEEEKLKYILECARVAPTAVNAQPQRILVLNKKEEIERLKKATPFTFDAPTVLIVCYDEEEAWKRRKFDGKCSGETDAAIITSEIILAATEQGIGTTWVMYFDPEQVRKEFQIPDHYQICSLVPMGYAKEGYVANPRHLERKALEETVFYHEF